MAVAVGGSGAASTVSVEFLCPCGQAATIHSLYWCRHCITLRCPRCVLQEIDSFFCPSCLDEHMPSTEAKLNQNRCAKCTECPICTNGLTTVAFSGGAGEPELLQLVCSYCHWSSKDIQLLGTQEALAKQIKERDHGAVAAQVTKLVEQFQKIAVEEGRAMEARRQSVTQALYRKTRAFSSRFSTFPHSAKLQRTLADVRTSYQQRRNKMYDQARNEWVDGPAPLDETLRSVPRTSFDSLPDDAFAGPSDLNEVTTIAQRFAHPAMQPRATSDMTVQQTRLLAKRSKRCTTCQHNLIKPELSPVSIKFKMQLFALHHVPNIKILKLPTFQFDQTSEVILVLTNPMDQRIELTFSQAVNTDELDATTVVAAAAEAVAEAVVDAVDGVDGVDGVAAAVDDAVADADTDTDGDSGIEQFARKPTAECVLPSAPVVLKEHDPVQEMSLDESSHDDVQDDPAVVVARHANSIHLRLPVTPKVVCENVSVSFCLKYACKVTTTSLRQAEPSKDEFKDVVLPVFIDFGPVSLP